ncbi:MAG: prolipoprotein diacylglyceryl transferase, partial [Pirellulales bacterium]|nr:prolipoprotein diacylglyceryl transferase [Pirellulales bacterium]
MLQTLFHVPDSIAGLPVFGFGLLFGLWLMASLAVMAYLVKQQGWTSETQSYLPVLIVIGVVIVFVLPALIEPGGVPIRGYGVMLLLAVVSGVGLCLHRARRMGLNPDIIYSLAFWMFIGGMLGARLFYIIEYWDQFQRESLGATIGAMINVAQGGLVVYGSLIGALIAFVAFVRRHKLPALALADLIAPGMALGLCLGRIGCLLNGCCYGGICEPPRFGSGWAVTFPAGSPPHQRQIESGQLNLHGMTIGYNSSGMLVVEQVAQGSPADVAGIKPNDRIRSVRGPGDDSTAVRSESDVKETLQLSTRPGASLSVFVNDEPLPKIVTFANPLPRSRAVHPTQVYSSINAALICLLMLAVYPYRMRDGQVIALMLTIYPITRFLLEIIRTD